MGCGPAVCDEAYLDVKEGWVGCVIERVWSAMSDVNAVMDWTMMRWEECSRSLLMADGRGGWMAGMW